MEPFPANGEGQEEGLKNGKVAQMQSDRYLEK
jgi:hypothetical protein